MTENTLFYSKQILPEEYATELQNGLLVLCPLFNGDVQYGYLLLDTHNANLSLEYLSYTVSQALENIHYRTSLKAVNRSLSVLASTDSLTEMLRKETFEECLTQALSQASNDETIGCVLFIDLDGFKLVNDSAGHYVGDLLLQEVARRIRKTFRDSDNCARIGGDEFAVLLNKVVSRPQVMQLARRLLAQLCKPFEVEGRALSISASIGVAHFSGQTETVASVMQQADTAMYQAKASGKKRIVFADNVAMPENSDTH